MTLPDPTPGPYGTGRVTEQRRRIAEAAAALRGAFSVDDLADELQRSGDAAGLATVYRAVTALVGSGWLERIGEREGSALFAHCCEGGHHHHHVICDGCGRVEATPCPVPAASESGGSADAAGGFIVTRHEVTLYGLCPECAAGSGTSPTHTLKDH